jgi:hypothetical protein
MLRVFNFQVHGMFVRPNASLLEDSATAQLAVDGDVEQRQIAHGAGKLSIFVCPIPPIKSGG